MVIILNPNDKGVTLTFGKRSFKIILLLELQNLCEEMKTVIYGRYDDAVPPWLKLNRQLKLTIVIE